MLGKNSNNHAILESLGLLSTFFLTSFLVSPLHTQAQLDASDTVNTSIEDYIQTSLFQQGSKPYGLTFGEWTAKWWQWAYAIPKNTNPSYDDTGRYCAVNQKGPVWFFPGSFGKDVLRHCTVPSGKAILFPILNSECSFAEFPNLKNEWQLRLCAKQIQDSVIQLKASVDKENITNLEEFRVQSPLFNFTLPENNIVGLPPQNTQAVSDGNWVFLKPLPEGEHVISFEGGLRNTSTEVQENKNSDFSFAVPYGWDNKVTYHISIVGNNNSSLPVSAVSKIQNLTNGENRQPSNLLNPLSQNIENSLEKAEAIWKPQVRHLK